MDYNEIAVYATLRYYEQLPVGADLNGIAVVYELGNGESKERAIQKLVGTNLTAFYFIAHLPSVYPGFSEWDYSGEKTTNDFPVFELVPRQNDSLTACFNGSSEILIKLDDPANVWDTTFHVAMPIVAIIILVLNFFIAVLGVYKMTMTVLENGFHLFTLNQMVFVLNILACLERMLFCVVSAFGSYHFGNSFSTQTLLTYGNVVTLSPCYLIILYWHEAIQLSSKSQVYPFLTKFKIPFFIIMVLLWVMDLALGACRGAYLNITSLLLIGGVLELGTMLFVMVFFIVTRIRLQNLFNRLNKSVNKRSNNKLRLATNNFYGLLVCLALAFVVLIMISFIWPVRTPKVWPFIWVWALGCVSFGSFFQLRMIRSPDRPWKWIFCGLFVSDPASLLRTDNSDELQNPGATSTLSTRSSHFAASTGDSSLV